MRIDYLNIKEEFRYICFDVEGPFLKNVITGMLEDDPERHRVFDPLSEMPREYHNELVDALVGSYVAIERIAQAASAAQELDHLKEAIGTSMQARTLLQQGGFTDQAKTAGDINRTLRKRYALLEGRLRRRDASCSPSDPPTQRPGPAP